jgi:lysozyme family protein
MANFDPAFDKMIRNEGGFKLTNIEGDRGGQTYAGIARNASTPTGRAGDSSTRAT